MEGIAIVTLLCFVSIRSREWLPRGETVQTVHVGDRRACYTAGVKENANDRIRVEAGTSGSELDDVDNARVSVVVRAKGRVHGPKVSRHRAFVVDEGNGEPESRDVPRGLATGPEVDYEVLVSDGPRNGASERRHLGIIEPRWDGVLDVDSISRKRRVAGERDFVPLGVAAVQGRARATHPYPVHERLVRGQNSRVLSPGCTSAKAVREPRHVSHVAQVDAVVLVETREEPAE